VTGGAALDFLSPSHPPGPGNLGLLDGRRPNYEGQTPVVKGPAGRPDPSSPETYPPARLPLCLPGRPRFHGVAKLRVGDL
jgi:hypothetical protein